jgi:hypothetical protein
MKKMRIRAKDREFFEYNGCAKDVLNASGSTSECPRPDGHGGSCRPTIPFNDYKVIATAATTGPVK